MHLTTTSRRTAGVLAATALAGLMTVAPAHARQDPGELFSDTDSSPRDSMPTPTPTVITIDDNAVEYLQVGLGAIGGMLVVGAVSAGARRRHAHARPA